MLDACYSQVIMLSGCAVFIVYNMTEVERERGRERERERESERARVRERLTHSCVELALASPS